MESKIARALKMQSQPIAVVWTNQKPADAVQFQPGKAGCVAAMLNVAAKGRTVAFDAQTCGCAGGAVGLGFDEYKLGFIEDFLSTGSKSQQGEYYKKTPELAREYVLNTPVIPTPTKYVVLKPLAVLGENEGAEAVIFLVNPDQLSALVFLANYDRPTQDNVVIRFSSGCQSVFRQVLAEAKAEYPRAVVGLVDPSARSVIDKDLLSFSLTYTRFLELEGQVEESFLTKETWLKLSMRT